MDPEKKYFHPEWFSKYRNELFGLSMIELIFFHYTENISSAVDEGIISINRAPFLYYFHDFIGSIGVEIFIILSGMGLFYSFEKNHDLWHFYKRRMRRVVIPYLIIAIPFWLIRDNIFSHEGAVETVKDISFYTFFSQGTNTIWFIGFIIAMYLVFPVIYVMVGKRGSSDIRNTLLLIALLDFSMVFMRIRFPDIGGNISIAYGRVPDFVLGVFLGKYIQDDKKIRRINAALISVLGISTGIWANMFFEKGTYERLFTPFFAIGVMILVSSLLHLINQASIIMRFFRLVGKYSLEIYVCHIALRSLMNDGNVPLYLPQIFLCMIAMAIVMAWALKRIDKAIPA